MTDNLPFFGDGPLVNDTTVTTPDGRTLAVRAVGDPHGLPVFVLHGTPGSRHAHTGDPQAVALAGVHLIGYDRPGFGGSDRQIGRRVADAAADIAAIADHFDAPVFRIVGGSGGGPHALAAAAALPDRVAAVAAISCPAPVAPLGAAWTDNMIPMNQMPLQLARQGRPALEAALTQIARQMTADPRGFAAAMGAGGSDARRLQGNEQFAPLRDGLGEALAQGVGGWADDTLALLGDWGVDLGAIRCPALLFAGRADRMVPEQHTRWLEQATPNAVVKWSRAGHTPGPKAMATVMRDLLAA